MHSQLISEVEKSANILLNGGIIAYPTETVWGIGCMANNAAAVDKIYQLKQRDKTKPLLVLVNGIEMIHQIKTIVSPLEKELLNSNEPTTVILDHVINLPENLLGDNNSLGIRITTQEFCRLLIEKIKVPLVSTSANFSGKPSAKTKSELDSDLIKRLDYLVNLNPTSSEKPSRIVKVVNENIVVLRA